MFKKKSSLLKKVWRLKASTLAEPDAALLHNVLKNMDERQLSTLLKSVETAGGCETACIGPSAKCRKVAVCEQKVILLRAFCCAELRSIAQLKQLHGCTAAICLNPYHSSLVIDSELPPPPYTLVDVGGRTADSVSSLTTPSFLEDLSSSEESEPLDSGIDDSSHSPPGHSHSPPGQHHQLLQPATAAEDSDSMGCTNLLFDECSIERQQPARSQPTTPSLNNNRPPAAAGPPACDDSRPPDARSGATDQRSTDLRTTERPPTILQPCNYDALLNLANPAASGRGHGTNNTPSQMLSSPEGSSPGSSSSSGDHSMHLSGDHPMHSTGDHPMQRQDESSESSGSHYKEIIEDASLSLSGTNSSHSSSHIALLPARHPDNESTDHHHPANDQQPANNHQTACHRRQAPQQTTTAVNPTCPLHGAGRHSTCGRHSQQQQQAPLNSPHHASHHRQPTQTRGPWCKMMYWEQKTRVGPVYEAQDPACVNVFENLPQGTGFCLALLGAANDEQSMSRRIRVKIRYGIQLTREPGGCVWLYNRSNHVLFTWSPSLQLEATGDQLAGGQQQPNSLLQGDQQAPPQVKRVPVGCSIKVFDRSQILELQRAKLINTTPRLPSNAPTFKRFNIRVSFAKGWGQGYRRTFITQCPCWLECFLNDQMVA